MAKHLAQQYASSYSSTVASTAYSAPSNLFIANATESNVRVTHRGASITIRNWRMNISTHTRTQNTTFTWFKNGAAQSLAISVAGGATGVVEDTTNSVSLTAGDTHSVRAVHAAEGAANQLTCFGQYEIETAGGASSIPLAATSAGSTFGASTTTYFRFWQFSSSGAVSNDRPDHDMQVAGTFSGLYGYINANTRSDATTLALYKNGASAISVSVAAGVTGRFENTANSTTVAVGDDVHLRNVTGAGTGTIIPHAFGSHFTPTTAGESPTICGPHNTTGFTSGSVLYHGITPTATETVANWIARFDAVASRLVMRATVNTCTTATLGQSRKNAANGNQSVSLAAGVTGVTIDTSNTDSLTTGDLFNARITYGTMPDVLSRFTLEVGKLVESTGISGTSTMTDATDTVTATGSITNQGAVSITDATDTVTATASITNQGSAILVDADDGVTSTLVQGTDVEGEAIIVDADDVVTFTASITNRGSFSMTDEDDIILITNSNARGTSFGYIVF
jgi:hypothetical protein